jgi:hypothetical protein
MITDGDISIIINYKNLSYLFISMFDLCYSNL